MDVEENVWVDSSERLPEPGSLVLGVFPRYLRPDHSFELFVYEPSPDPDNYDWRTASDSDWMEAPVLWTPIPPLPPDFRFDFSG